MHDHTYSSVVVASLNFRLCSPGAKVDTAGVLTFHDNLLAKVSESCNVAPVFCSGLHAPVNAVVNLLGQVVCDFAFET